MECLAEGGLDDEIDELLCEEVRDPEERARDHDEAEDDRGGLTDLTAVRPLHALELGPGGAEEVGEATAAAAVRVLRRSDRPAHRRRLSGGSGLATERLLRVGLEGDPLGLLVGELLAGGLTFGAGDQ